MFAFLGHSFFLKKEHVDLKQQKQQYQQNNTCTFKIMASHSERKGNWEFFLCSQTVPVKFNRGQEGGRHPSSTALIALFKTTIHQTKQDVLSPRLVKVHAFTEPWQKALQAQQTINKDNQAMKREV